MTAPPKVRFCPSPTGMFHVGGARTALFNWLFARQLGGTFLLRIEDTDEARNRPEWTDGIYAAMTWLGLDWDDTYPQSRNQDAHRETALKLFADGSAYYCACAPGEAHARNKANGIKTPRYDRHCRDLGLEAGPGRALRFRVPQGTIPRVDVIRGATEIDVSAIEDFAILRASGDPLFVFANALDDVDDGITHVIRGDDHLSNVEKQILIRQAVGAPEPTWAHLPLIVNEKRVKLSKRTDKVAMEAYRDEGILPEAMVNYLGTLGWSPPGDEEIVPLETLRSTFRLEDVNKSSAQFDDKKLLAFNGHYLRSLPRDEFIDRALAWYRATIVEPMADVIQERGATFPETLAMTDFFLHDAPPIDRTSWDKTMKRERARVLLEAVGADLRAVTREGWTAGGLKEAIEATAERVGAKIRDVHGPLRVAITGRSVGPPIYEALVVLGGDRTHERVGRALAQLAPPAP